MDIIFAFKNDTDSRSKFEEVVKLIKNAHNNLKAPYEDQELKDKIKTSILSNVKEFKL
jgi:heme oxygenase